MTKQSKPGLITGNKRADLIEHAIAQAADPEMKKALKAVAYELFLQYTRSRIENITEFEIICAKLRNLSLKSLSWTQLCSIAKGSATRGNIIAKLLAFMLSNNFYEGAHKAKLIELKDCFDSDSRVPKSPEFYNKFFCGDSIRFMYKTPLKSFTGLMYINCDSPFLSKLLYKYSQITATKTMQLKTRTIFYEKFATIFTCGSSIKSFEDLDCPVFEEMLDNCKRYPCDTDEESIALLCRLKSFLLFLCHEAAGLGITILKKTDPLSIRILQRNDLPKLILQGYKSCYYNPLVPAPDADLWLINTTGYESTSTRLTAGKLICCDFTCIRSLFFRKLVKKCVWEMDTPVLIDRLYNVATLGKTLNELTNIVKDEQNLKIEDISRLRIRIVSQQNKRAETKNSLISITLNFLRYCQREGYINTEQYALDGLTGVKKNDRKNVKAPLDKDIEAIADVLKNKAKESTKNAYCYIIFILLLQTEFRISQICKLTADCIIPTMVSTAYNLNDKMEESDKQTPKTIITASKSSHGQTYKTTITDYGKKLIDDALQLSKQFRDLDTELSKYLFIFRNDGYSSLQVINADIFRQHLTDCCKEAGVRNYSPTKLREYHMTKAEEFRIQKKYSSIRLNELTGHSSQYTTYKHYIEAKILPYVASLAKVNIGRVDLDGYIMGEITDDIPENIKDKAHQTNQGTGYCKLDICKEQSNISCLLCKWFVTTPEKIPEFKALLEHYDSLINDARYEHDKDDIINIKKLIACYLAAIYLQIGKQQDTVALNAKI